MESKHRRTNPQPTLLTSSQGTKSSVWNRVNQRKKFPFGWNDLFRALQFCGWDPTLGDALNFYPFPAEIPDTFQNPETDQLPAPPCQMLSYFCCYCRALASASGTRLFSEDVVPSVSSDKMRVFQFFSDSCICSGFSSFFPPLSVWCICSPVICLSESQS